jgi:DNA invertase Pin-like site-specific DNA recombinase
MRVLYVRVSTIDQKTDRQRVNESEYDFIVEDRVSGSVPFQERQGGRQVLDMLNKGFLTELAVWQIDRIGRDIRDIINTLHTFSSLGVCVTFINQGLRTLGSDGKENPISKLVINLLGIISEMERNQILERQRQGVELAKARGVYKGRKQGTKEDTLKFLSKPKNTKAIELLKKGYKCTEVSKIVGVHVNTITKIKTYL